MPGLGGGFCSGGVPTWGMPAPGGACLGGVVSQHALRQAATAADGTHRTRMRSCTSKFFYSSWSIKFGIFLSHFTKD